MATRRTLRARFRDLLTEVRARRAGRMRYSSTQTRAIRHIAGPTGFLAQNTLGPATRGAEAYGKSFEPRVPPSLHISHADALRRGIVVPVRERCIEDWQKPINYTDPHDEMSDDLS